MSNLPNSLNPEEFRRPLAAFFMPESDPCLYGELLQFRDNYRDLFVKDWAVVGQVGGDRDSSLPFSESLIIDTRHQEYGRFVCELIQSSRYVAHRWLVDVGNQAVSGRYMRNDSQGVLRANQELDSGGLKHVERFIIAALKGDYVRANIEQKYRQRLAAHEKLDQMITDSAAQKMIQKQQELLGRIGFGSLEVYTPPQHVKAQGVVTEEGRRMFLESVERTQQLRATSVRE